MAACVVDKSEREGRRNGAKMHDSACGELGSFSNECDMYIKGCEGKEGRIPLAKS